MAGTRNGQLLTIPRGILFDIVECTNATEDNALVIAVVTIVHAPVPIVHQGPVEHVVVDLLFHRHGDAMNANL